MGLGFLPPRPFIQYLLVSKDTKFPLAINPNACRYHLCCLCSTRILCDKSLIARHVEKRHRMGLEEYAELSERKAGSSRGTADPDHADAGPPLSAEERKAGLKRAVAPMPRPVEGTR